MISLPPEISSQTVLLRIERIAALVDIGEIHRFADGDRAAIGLFLPGDHAEQRCLARAVRADHADNAARRQFEIEIVDQQLVAIGLGNVFRLDHHIAETLAHRNDDLRIARLAVIGGFDQFVIGLDTRLGLGLARLGRGGNPLALAGNRLLLGGFLAAFLRHALGLGFQIGGVIALIGNAAAAVEFENPAGHIVKEVAVMGDHHHGTGIFAQMLFQPGNGFRIQMVGRLVEQQQVRLGKQQFAQRDAADFTARQICRRMHPPAGSAGHPSPFQPGCRDPTGSAHRSGPEARHLVRRLVRIVHHQFIVAVENGLLVGNAFHDVFQSRSWS